MLSNQEKEEVTVSNKQRVKAKIIRPQEQPVVKAENPTQLEEDIQRYAEEWIEPDLPLESLGEMVKNSNILPQCIHAYRNNIAGYGIGIKYIDNDQKETEETKAEWQRLQNIIELLTIEQDTKQIFEDIIEARDVYKRQWRTRLYKREGDMTEQQSLRYLDLVNKKLHLLISQKKYNPEEAEKMMTINKEIAELRKVIVQECQEAK